jgi:hypothetical protein
MATTKQDESVTSARTLPDTRGWRRWPSDRVRAVMEQVDDSTELWDSMADELAEREHEHEVRVLNGGILP